MEGLKDGGRGTWRQGEGHMETGEHLLSIIITLPFLVHTRGSHCQQFLLHQTSHLIVVLICLIPKTKHSEAGSQLNSI